MTNLEIKRNYQRKGWRFKVLALNLGIRATKGIKKITGTSFSNLFKKMKENGSN